MLSLQGQSQAPIGRSRVGKNAGRLTMLDDRVPGAVVRFKIDFRNGRNLIQHSRPYLITNLLDAARLEVIEYLMNEFANLDDNVPGRECRFRIDISPVEVEPHMQRPVSDVGECS